MSVCQVCTRPIPEGGRSDRLYCSPKCRNRTASLRRKGKPMMIIMCKHCGEEGPHAGHGYIESCYKRWIYRNRPETGPPPRYGPRGESVARAERRRAYDELRKSGLTIDEAASRIGVSRRTATTYESLCGVPTRAAAWREDYDWLRSCGETVEQAARRVGITLDTALKHERTRKAVTS